MPLVAISSSLDADSRVTGVGTAYGANGAITTQGRSYVYDNGGQLQATGGYGDGVNTIGHVNPDGSSNTSYAYDPSGNRTGETNSAGNSVAHNEVLNDGTYRYTYDNEGNLTSRTQLANGQVTLYTWDFRNRLTEVRIKNSSGTVLTDETFTYDALDRRIGDVVSTGGTTTSTWTAFDGEDVYADFTGSTVTLSVRYLHGDGGELLARAEANGSVGWYLTDAEGSVRAIVDTSGTILDELSYGPYGELTIETSATAGDRFKYAGGAYDSATGLEEFGNRYYYASMGRWISQDPTGFGGGDANLSRYAGNDPMNMVDPSGLRANQAVDGPSGSGGSPASSQPVQLVDINDFGDELAEEKQWRESEVAKALANPFYMNTDFYSYMRSKDPETFKALIEHQNAEILARFRAVKRPFNIDQVSTEQPSFMDDLAAYFFGNPVKANPDSIGKPGLVGSFVPVYGSGRASIDAFQNGAFGVSALYAGMATAELVTGVFGLWMLGAKVVGWTAAREGAAEVAALQAERVAADVAPNALRQTGSGFFTGSADEAYNAIRASTNDVNAIARNTGIKPANIQKVKDHLFHQDHLLDRYVDYGIPAEMRPFDSDLGIANAWKRLEQGTQTPADLQLLRHEAAESHLMNRLGDPSYNRAHNRAQQSYPAPKLED